MERLLISRGPAAAFHRETSLNHDISRPRDVATLSDTFLRSIA